MESGLCTPDASLPQPAGRVLARSFFARPSDQVAPDLVGKILWVAGVGGGRLTEVEAYLPEDDPASHAFRGRTPRNAAMFGPPGSIYVFQSYGVHLLLNLVCGGEGVAAAVLVRSFEPVGDTRVLECNRSLAPWPEAREKAGEHKRSGRDLSAGPGRVGQALGVHRGLNGLPLGKSSGVWVIDDDWRPEVACSTRIGISRGDALLLRYYAAGSVYVSGSSRSRSEGT